MPKRAKKRSRRASKARNFISESETEVLFGDLSSLLNKKVSKKRKASKLKKVGDTKMAKKKRSAAQRAATRKLVALMKKKRKGGKAKRKAPKKRRAKSRQPKEVYINPRKRRKSKRGKAFHYSESSHKVKEKGPGTPMYSGGLKRVQYRVKGDVPVRRTLNTTSPKILRQQDLELLNSIVNGLSAEGLMHLKKLGELNPAVLMLATKMGLPLDDLEDAKYAFSQMKKLRGQAIRENRLAERVTKKAEQYKKDGADVSMSEANPRKKAKKKKSKKRGSKARGSKSSTKSVSLYSRKAKRKVSIKVSVNPSFLGINVSETANTVLWGVAGLAISGIAYGLINSVSGGKVDALVAAGSAKIGPLGVTLPGVITMLSGAAIAAGAAHYLSGKSRENIAKAGGAAVGVGAVMVSIAAYGFYKAHYAPQVSAMAAKVPLVGKYLAPALAGVQFFPGMHGLGSADFGALGDGYKQQPGDWGMTQVGGVPHGMRGVEFIPNRSRGMKGVPSGMGEVQFYAPGADGDDMYRDSEADDAMEAEGLGGADFGGADFGLIPSGL